MTVQYIQLQYEEYKELEEQMREFKETTHTSVEGFYHKSIRLRINPGLIMEFLGPLVLAGQAILEPEIPAGTEPLGPGEYKDFRPCAERPEGHDWVPDGGTGHKLCQRCGARKTGGM